MSCNRVRSPDGVDYTFCTGKVPSFDGTPHDVDLSVPADLLQARLPLVAMIGGNDNHKTTWESGTVRNAQSPAADGYNNVALAQRGHAVLTYSRLSTISGVCS